MRLLIVTIASLFVVGLAFLTVKFWGQGQTYAPYNHPVYSMGSGGPIEFIKVKGSKAAEKILNSKSLYIEVAITADQKMIVPLKERPKNSKSYRFSQLNELGDSVLELDPKKFNLKDKIILFNIIENAQAVHENFFEIMKQHGLEKGNNFIVMSPYEAPLKALKTLAPAYLFGTSQPEILKIIAMNSMFLIEAANIRADLIVHPLKVKNQDFFTKEFLEEFRRRHKRWIVGPVLTDVEIKKARELEPFGIIIE